MFQAWPQGMSRNITSQVTRQVTSQLKRQVASQVTRQVTSQVTSLVKAYHKPGHVAVGKPGESSDMTGDQDLTRQAKSQVNHQI